MTAEGLHIDPRARRTLEALQVALSSLMREKQLSEISVSEICREAGVHRTTFYKHFESVAQLAGLTVTGLLGRITLTEGFSEEDVPGGAASFEEWFGAFAEHVAERREAYGSILGEKGDPGLQTALSGKLVARTAHALRGADAQDLGISPQAAALILGQASFGAVLALVRNPQTAPEQAVQAVLGQLPAAWRAAVQAPAGETVSA